MYWSVCSLLISNPLCAAKNTSVSPDEILALIAPTGGEPLPFAELHPSHLLKKPLWLTGQFRHPDQDTFVREVLTPYHERTLIGSDTIIIERDQQRTRRYALANLPEMVEINGIKALFAGDRTALRNMFALQSEGSQQAWELILLPQTPTVAHHTPEIHIYGHQQQLRCLEIRPNQGIARLTLLGQTILNLTSIPTPEQLAHLCHGHD